MSLAKFGVRHPVSCFVSTNTQTRRLACLAITGTFETTPTVAMELLIGIRLLHLIVEKKAAAMSFPQLRDIKEFLLDIGSYFKTGER